MVRIILDYYFNQYLILKSKNVVNFCVHLSPIFSHARSHIRLDIILEVGYVRYDIGSRIYIYIYIRSQIYISEVEYDIGSRIYKSEVGYINRKSDI